MLDKFMEKLMQSASPYIIPSIGSMTETRAKELELVKSKVRTAPQEVEEWFDLEINKIKNLDINDIVNNMAKEYKNKAQEGKC